jgi:hypothetical protein
MAAYTGTLLGTNSLGRPGDLGVVRGRFTFAAATLVTADTFSIDLFTQNGIEVPVEVLGVTVSSSTTTPASLTMRVGNSGVNDGFMIATGMTGTGQLVRKGQGSLVGTRVLNKTVTMGVTVDAGAAYTGTLDLEFLVKRTND